MNAPAPFPIKCLGSVEKVDLLQLPHISTGIKGLDKYIVGLFEGQLIVVTGKRGQGKSTFASWILSNALNQGRNIFAYSGELPDYHFRNWLDMQIAGRNNIDAQKNEYGDYTFTLRDDAAKKLSAFYDCRAYIFDNSVPIPHGCKLQDVLIKSIEYAANNLNCSVILVDNIMTAVDMLNNDPYAVQGDFVKQLKAIAREKKLTVILIAHPRKTKNGEEIVGDDVSGSGDITNLADVVLTYSRLNPDNDEQTESGKYQSAISILKNRLTGRLTSSKTPIKVSYSEATKRLISDEDTSPDALMCCFDPKYIPF